MTDAKEIVPQMGGDSAMEFGLDEPFEFEDDSQAKSVNTENAQSGKLVELMLPKRDKWWLSGASSLASEDLNGFLDEIRGFQELCYGEEPVDERWIESFLIDLSEKELDGKNFTSEEKLKKGYEDSLRELSEACEQDGVDSISSQLVVVKLFKHILRKNEIQVDRDFTFAMEFRALSEAISNDLFQSLDTLQDAVGNADKVLEDPNAYDESLEIIKLKEAQTQLKILLDGRIDLTSG